MSKKDKNVATTSEENRDFYLKQCCDCLLLIASLLENIYLNIEDILPKPDCSEEEAEKANDCFLALHKYVSRARNRVIKIVEKYEEETD